MKNFYSTSFIGILLVFLTMHVHIHAQLPANCVGSSPKVLIAGDSWAQYMADDNVYNEALKMYGHADKLCLSETYEVDILCSSNPGPNDYAVSGSEAKEWADETNYSYLQNLINAVNANPTVEFIILSIGGNDILRGRSGGGWYKDMNLDLPGSETSLFNVVNNDTWYIMNQVWARARPDIRFIIMSYDFPNFNVNSLWCGFYACDKREDLSRDANNNGSIDASELITDQEISDMMVKVENIRKTTADSHPLVYYDNSMGLTHYYYGYDDGLYPTFTAGSTLEPMGTSPYLPGGDLSTPTDRDNFRLVGVCGLPGLISADPIHLDADAYLFKSKNLLDDLLFNYYRGNPDETVFSEPTYDGYIDAITGSTNTNGIRVGDNGGSILDGVSNDYRGIISFNTSSIPDDVIIDGASLYMIRSGANDNPFNHNDRNPILDIKSGYFGSSLNLESADATAAADASNIGCFHGVADANKYAIRIDLDESALQYINPTGTTQFRFMFDYADWSPEYINFYDGGGTPARTLREDEKEKIYRTWKIIRTTDEFGKSSEEIVNIGDEIIRKPGFVYQPKMIEQKIINNNTIEEQYVMRDVIEHPGLAKIMNEQFGAPGGGYSPFLDISYTTLLPIEIAYFNAVKSGNNSLLQWASLSELNTSHFEIEHSKNNINWNYVGEVKSVGNSNSLFTYEFVHETPNLGINYYRLKNVDLDATYTYTESKYVIFEQLPIKIKTFPNPFKKELTLELNNISTELISIQLLDVLGREVYSSNHHLTENSFATKINLEFLDKGVHFLIVKAGLKSETIKVVKE